MTPILDPMARALSRFATLATLALVLAGVAGCGGGGTQFASGGIVGTGEARVV